jgi:pimeloyl-ACP methyl ester carboxylesterase
MSVSRALADRGFLVITPDIRMFREFRIGPQALDEIVFWFDQVKTLTGGDKIRRLGIGGISFSGTLALIAAARPEVRDRVAYVLAIGPYDDPLRCTRGWFGSGPVTVGEGYYPTRFYAKWIIMLAAIDLVPGADERLYLHSVLIALLLQKQVPERPAGLSEAATRWYRLALMREDQSDAELTRKIEDHLNPSLYRPITPDRAATEVRCPVFLVHGAYDDLIPPEESLRLRSRLTHSKCYLLVSPFLTHTHPLDKPLSWREKSAGIVDIFFFFFSLSRVTADTSPGGPRCYC